MPKELIKEFIGKVCSISLIGEFGVTAKIIDIEENWVKVQEKDNNVKLINGDVIKSIDIMPDKYQK